MQNFNRYLKGNFILFWVLLILFIVGSSFAQSKITTPKEQFGFNIGDDYTLITYSQLEEYWKKLDQESPRMLLEEIGKTAEGRPQYMAIITAPENFGKLNEYKNISRQLALAEGVTDEQAKKLAQDGKAVIWIDGGLHATEVVGSHQLMEMVYQMVSLNDEETMRFLNDVILLAVHANPDGMELVSNWYMREADPKKRTTSNIPKLYQKYIGHDNNRDAYMVTQPETENQSRIMYQEWFPQIMYNHHQTGPSGLIVFIPPFRDPPNYNYDPLILLGIESVGVAMQSRLAAEGKPGGGTRSVASYSIWFNGNQRTTGYFHNQIGLLTEIKGNPTPLELDFNPDRYLQSIDIPFPVEPKTFHFREAIEYSITMNRAVLDYASRNKEILLYNRYQMGRNSIERGNKDTWTVHPKLIDEVKETAPQKRETNQPQERSSRRGRNYSKEHFKLVRKPENRDPRGYILPSDQPDFPTATKFVNTFIKNGVTVHQARQDFQVAGKKYPAGSYVFKCAQAFRPHILDMFEPQDHPNDFIYEGGPPRAPYDNAGYTLAFQMGIKFDRILEDFNGPFEEIKGLAKPYPGQFITVKNPDGFLISHEINDAVIATNRLLKEKHDIYWLKEPITTNKKTYPAGSIYIKAKSSTASTLKSMTSEFGINIEEINQKPKGNVFKLNPVRIGLWDRYGGSMQSGWTRWILEQYEFPFEVVYPKTLDAGNLYNKFDILVFVSGAIPAKREDNDSQERYGSGRGPDPETIPAEYRDWPGSITADKTIPQLLDFLKQGGTILTIGSSANFYEYADLPLGNHIVDGKGNQLSSEEYYIPSSVLQVRVDNSQPLAYGITERLDIFFSRSPVFRLQPEADKQGITSIAWYDSDAPLRSGWAWGQHHLYGGTAIVEAKIGHGCLYLVGPEILFRAQPHGTFKFFFNGIYLSNAKEEKL